jgi:hypothetical protein
VRLKLAPEYCTVGLKKFGINPYGQPNFRVIFAPTRTRIQGGFWADVARSEYRIVGKYGNTPRWLLEKWLPGTTYGTPESWYRETVTPDGLLGCGPYPVHGEYESCEVFQAKDADGRALKGWAGFVPLEPGLVELTARAVWMGRINSYSDIRIALRDEELNKEKEKDALFDQRWAEQQAQREGLTIGFGGRSTNKAQEIDDMARKIERVGAYVNAAKFRPGFKQKGVR